MPEELTTKQFIDLETGRPVSNPVYIGDVYDADGADAVMRLFGQDKTRDTCGRVGDYRITDDPVLAPNHLWPDGSPIDPTAWPELHAYAARVGWQTDAAGRFLLPDLRGKFLVGVNSADPDFVAGKEGGEKSVSLTESQNARHRHVVYTSYTSSTAHTHYGQDSGANAKVATGITGGEGAANMSTTYSGNSEPHNNLPPYRAVYIQIRARPDPLVAQSVNADMLGGIGAEGYIQTEKAAWKTATGTTSVKISTAPEHEMVILAAGNNGSRFFTFFVPVNAIPDTGSIEVRDGFYRGSDNYGDCILRVSKSAVTCLANVDTGSNWTDSTKLQVYYW